MSLEVSYRLDLFQPNRHITMVDGGSGRYFLVFGTRNTKWQLSVFDSEAVNVADALSRVTADQFLEDAHPTVDSSKHPEPTLTAVRILKKHLQADLSELSAAIAARLAL